MVLAGFSFDAYTEVDKAAGVWISDGGTDQPGLGGVQVVLFSPRYVRDACRGILRVRVLSCEELRGIPVAGSVAVAFRTESRGPGDFLGSTRCSTRRGVLNGLARWRDEDESVFLYVPRGTVDPDDMKLTVEVQKRDILDMQPLGVVGRATIPISRWGHGELREVRIQLQQAGDGEGAVGPPSIIHLQLQYDAFGKVGAATLEEGTEGQALQVDGELMDDVTPEKRDRRRRYGTAVPHEVENTDVKNLSERSLQERLRGRALPCVGEGTEALRERLQKSLDAEAKLKKAGGLWSTVEFVVGSDAKQRIEGALEIASAVSESLSESLSGDLFGALGAGLASGVTEVPGVKELMRGDFSGAFEQRRKIMEAASTDEGRQAIQRKVDGAIKRARQQAMLRLANGMELMSVRRGAWRMLERAVLEEGHGSFADYEALCYLEARATNTECWVWRYLPGKRLVVAFRGTSDFGDVLTDIAASPRDFGQYGKVHEGFLRAYESIREALIAALERGFGDEEGGAGWEVLFTGHSLGGALATLASLDVTLQSKYRGVVDDIGKAADEELTADLGIPRSPLADAEIIACTFGAPRVGSARMCWLYDRVVPKAWRIYSSSDIIPTVPPTTLFGFRHAGIGVELDPASSELTVRGRTPGLREAAEAERAEAELLEAAGREKEEPKRGGGDIWSSWNAADIAELRRVMGTGTQAVGEHMEDNYFARIQECLSAELRMKGEGEENFLL